MYRPAYVLDTRLLEGVGVFRDEMRQLLIQRNEVAWYLARPAYACSALYLCKSPGAVDVFANLSAPCITRHARVGKPTRAGLPVVLTD